MQRGLGMGKQLLIPTAWLSYKGRGRRGGGGSASWSLAHGSCSPHWWQIVLLHYWWGQVSIRQNSAALDDRSSDGDTDGIYLPSFIFMNSNTNQSLCASLQCLTQVCTKRPRVDQWFVIKPRPHQSILFIVQKCTLVFQELQWFSITLHLDWLWTHLL